MPRPIHYGQRAKMNLGKPQKQLPPPTPKDETPSRDQVIRDIVLSNIGTPDDLVEVQVKQLWDDKRYRVNVFREVKGVRRLCHSYFIAIGSDEVIGSPPLDRITHDDLLANISNQQK